MYFLWLILQTEFILRYVEIRSTEHHFKWQIAVFNRLGKLVVYHSTRIFVATHSNQRLRSNGPEKREKEEEKEEREPKVMRKYLEFVYLLSISMPNSN